MLIKTKRESMWGPAGKVVEVSDQVGNAYIKDGSATLVEVSHKMTASDIRNKSLSAR